MQVLLRDLVDISLSAALREEVQGHAVILVGAGSQLLAVRQIGFDFVGDPKLSRTRIGFWCDDERCGYSLFLGILSLTIRFSLCLTILRYRTRLASIHGNRRVVAHGFPHPLPILILVPKVVGAFTVLLSHPAHHAPAGSEACLGVKSHGAAGGLFSFGGSVPQVERDQLLLRHDFPSSVEYWEKSGKSRFRL